MSEVQTISIVSHEVKKGEAKPYVTYDVKVSTATRAWTIQRRYNDFCALHTELKSTTGKEPPAPLPPKHSFRFTRSIDDAVVRTAIHLPVLISERRTGLQEYLQRILACKDPRWRLAYGFLDFLAIPTNLPGSSTRESDSTADKLARYLPSSQAQGGSIQYTSSSWITEHNALQQVLRTVRSSLLKRDALAGMGDAGASRSAGIEAKRSLKDLKTRLESLDKGLADVQDLGQGERSRREGLVLSLKDEVGNVDKMAEAGVRVASNHSAATSMGRSGTPVNENDRKALLGGTSSRPPGRVFGAAANQAPQETTETRPLDDQGLLQLQQTQMDNQDGQLEQLSSVLQRQLKLGQEIGKEIGEQNDMLDDLSTQVDRTGGKLGRAKRQMNRLG